MVWRAPGYFIYGILQETLSKSSQSWSGTLLVSLHKESPGKSFQNQVFRHPVKIPCGYWPWRLQANCRILKGVPDVFCIELDYVRPHTLSDWFWNEFIKNSLWNLTALSTPIWYWFWNYCNNNSLWKLTKPLSRQTCCWFGKEFLNDSKWKLTRSSPENFPIDFERNPLKIPYGNWPDLWSNAFDSFWKEFLKDSIWD